MFSSVTSSFMAGHRVVPAGPAAFLANRFIYYDFSNPASYPGTGTTVTDLAGGNNNGTLSGSYTYTTSIPTNSAGTTVGMRLFNFSGRIRTPSVSELTLTPTGSPSFVMWMRAVTAPGVIVRKTTGSGAGFSINWGSATNMSMGSQSGSNTPDLGIGNNVITLNTWYMLAFSFSVGLSANMTLYVNDVNKINKPITANYPAYLDATIPLDFEVPNGDAYIGEIHVFNSWLTQNNITYIYDLTKSRYI